MDSVLPNESEKPVVSPAIPVEVPILKPKNQILGWIVGGVIVLGIGVVAGFFLNKGLGRAPKAMPTPTPLPVSEITPTPNPTANWKTFNSPHYLFSFKFPSLWVSESPSPSGEFEDSGILDLHSPNVSPIAITINVEPTKGTTFSLQENSIIHYGWKGMVKTSFSIDGVDGIMFNGKLDNRDAKVALFSKNNYIYIFQTDVLDGLRFFDQILSTFKFTDVSSTGSALGKFCGGIANLPCPTGFRCKLDGSYPDAGGRCVN